MNYRIEAAQEVLSGMKEAANDRASLGLPVSEEVWAEIAKREREIDLMVEDHHAQFGQRRCTCGAAHHGGDCMCFE